MPGQAVWIGLERGQSVLIQSKWGLLPALPGPGPWALATGLGHPPPRLHFCWFWVPLGPQLLEVPAALPQSRAGVQAGQLSVLVEREASAVHTRAGFVPTALSPQVRKLRLREGWLGA